MKTKLINGILFAIPIIMIVGLLLAIAYPTKKTQEVKVDATGPAHALNHEVMTTEKRCPGDEILAEDGSCVNANFYIQTSSDNNQGGLTVNSTKTITSVTNNNDYPVMIDLQLQTMTNEGWTDLDWSDCFYLDANTATLRDNLVDQQGILRYSVSVYKVVGEGDVELISEFHTDTVGVDRL